MRKTTRRISRLRGRRFGAVVASACLVAGAAGGLVGSIPHAGAEVLSPINFETYATGTVNGQDGWTATGSAGSGCATYDEGVVNNTGSAPASFGAKSFRISDAVTSGCFSDQAFSKPVANAAGEPGADTGGFPSGTLQNDFSASFDIASATGAAQPGMTMSVSPDRGDGARMSYVRFEDDGTGWNLFFDDYRDIAPLGSDGNLNDGCGNPATGAPTGDDFYETQIASDLSPAVAHNIRFNMQLIPGPHNDIVQVYVDGVLKITGTSWEDYYRYCAESGGGTGGPLANESRTVRDLEFREGGTAQPADAGKGFLIDNVNLATGDAPGAPTITQVFDGSGSPAPPTAIGVSFTSPPAPGGAPITSETATCVGLEGEATVSATGLGSPIFLGGLEPKGAYSCTVTVTNAFGTSPASSPSLAFLGGTGECTVLPGAPGILSTGPGNASATVSWAPASGACIAGYVVTPYLGGVAQTPKLIPGPGTTTVVNGLTNGASYTFTVAAEDGSAVGPASGMTAPITAGAPSAVTALRVTNAGKGSLKLAFATPASNGSAITSYAATCTSKNQGVPKGKSGRAAPLTVTGLTHGKTYTCTVKAANRRGTGPVSHASAAIKA